MKKLTKIVAGLALSVCALLMPAQAKTVIRVGMPPQIGYSPLNVADAKGYWKEQGIKVEVVPYDDSQAVGKALASGEIDVGADLIGNWVGLQMQGLPIKIVAETQWSNGDQKLLIKSGQEIGKLKGQTVGINDKQVAQLFLLSKYLNSKGMRLADFKLVEQNPERLTDAFVKGQVQVAVLSDLFANDAIRRGNGLALVDSASYSGIMPQGFAANPQAMKELREDQWVKFFVGWLKAVNWIRGPNFKWGEYRDLLNAKTFKNFSAEGDAAMMDMLSGVKFLGVYEQIKRNGELGGLEYYLRDVLRFMKENGYIKNEPDHQTLLDTTHFQKALQAFK
ncbi:ABC transporter substrate-binding protein [Parachitinimonas caeni]|uniref:ABC transporter substrate-binding protein n=1 Tax=Parachitinimonas caeni TaxID=3031301 RepID=A0ABT7E1M5_9NEIS|nr:ABC transporter substrate-binding protein [Parachitinimonas caeni]MDK2126211.1 ABC transporter substrate-binding protein [Parachitinimonas caeni]